MDIALPATLLRDAFNLLIEVGAPVFGALLFTGIGVGVLQAATQINDPAMSFLPRLAALTAIGLGLGKWMMESASHFFIAAVTQMGGG